MGSIPNFRCSSSIIGLSINLFLVVILLLHFSACARQGTKGFEQIDGSRVHFSYVDKAANSVCVAGDFNGWSEAADCMSRKGERWTVELELAPGRYGYLFVVDGQVRRPDPGAFLNESNGFGGQNSVLIVD
ncbi:MAG: hypothetical protein RBS57_05940 [Desulforhabdus sp.]|jgi:1,4-alpha-glucan branching enzyme|nr:hypothetical protein [Desulforhabdus sp.]